MSYSRLKWLCLCALVAVCSLEAFAQGQYYRYINDEGVKVLGHSIPPQYVHKGYEIISANGRVLEVVAPAPKPEVLEKERERAELEAKYELLSKRYSTVRDIDAARQRKLVHVDASIRLVDGSIESIQREIDDITARAADFERAGKSVPQNILDTLAALNKKMAATRSIRQQRDEEKQILLKRFIEEETLFLRGTGKEGEGHPQASSVSVSTVGSSAETVSSGGGSSSLAASSVSTATVSENTKTVPDSSAAGGAK